MILMTKIPFCFGEVCCAVKANEMWFYTRIMIGVHSEYLSCQFGLSCLLCPCKRLLTYKIQTCLKPKHVFFFSLYIYSHVAPNFLVSFVLFQLYYSLVSTFPLYFSYHVTPLLPPFFVLFLLVAL